MGKVVKFELKDKSKESEEPIGQIDHELDMAREVMYAIVSKLTEYRYYPQEDEKLMEDLGLIFHVVYAMMLRTSGEFHQFHEMMDEIMAELERQKTGEGD